jgi:hypothetical protein
MTEAAARAAQSQVLIETMSKAGSAKGGAQAHSRGSKPVHQTSDIGNTNDKARDPSANKAARKDTVSNREATTKVSEKPRHRSDKDGDQDNSFEATIDNLGVQSPLDAKATASNLITTPAAWSGIVAQQQTQNNGRGDVAATDFKNAGLPGHLLKQESVVALLDARQRLLSAQDRQDLPADQMTEETVTTPMTVNARETHWAFDKATAAASTRTFESLREKGAQVSPLATATAGEAQAQHAVDGKSAKASLDAIGRPLAQSASVADASPQQNFDGAQDGRSGAREQPSANAGSRRIVDTSAPALADRISYDRSEAADNISAPTQQVRSGILTALKGDAGTAPMPNAPQMIDRPSLAGQVLRTIDLTLSPPDLGTVRLKLSLRASALDIDAEASKAATAKMLDDDRQGLEKSLRDAGYDVKSLKIAETSATANSSLNTSLNNAGSSFQDGSQARANFASHQDGNMQRQGGGTSDQSHQHPRDNKQQASPAPDVGNTRQANAIYI